MTRLLFWCEEFFAIGGCQVTLHRQILALLAQGYQVMVASRDRDGPLAPCPGIVHAIVADHQQVFSLLDHAGPFHLLYLQRIFKDDPKSHLEAVRRLSSLVPTLLRVPTLGDLDRLAHLDLRSNLGGLAGVIALSEGLAAEIAAHIGPVRVLHQRNGVLSQQLEVKRFSALGPFYYVGRLSPSKGVDVLLQGWEAYRAAGGSRELFVLGPAKQGHTVAQLADPDFLAQHRVCPLGSHRQVWEHVSGACAVVKPSRAEGHCNVMLEAMAAGIPLLASDIPGLREDITASGAGRLFPSGDAGALAHTLLEAEHQPEALGRMSEAGPEFIKKNRMLHHEMAGVFRAVESALAS